MSYYNERPDSMLKVNTTNDKIPYPSKTPPMPPVKEPKSNSDNVNHPAHYTDGKIEVIDYIEDKQLGFCLGNAVKYISRAGKKKSGSMSDREKEVNDLRKALWYVERRIKEIEELNA